MQKAAHNNIQVKCTMDEPIELLIDKLSTKSSDLYVFWQNYNQMYRQYNQKVNQNNKLREQIQILKRNLSTPRPTQVRTVQDPYLKDRLRVLEQNCQNYRAELQKYKSLNNQLKIEITKTIEQINIQSTLVAELKQQNSRQKQHIIKIIEQLKLAQNQLTGNSNIMEQIMIRDSRIMALEQKEKKMQQELEKKNDDIQDLSRACDQMKRKYQRIIKETVQSAKQQTINSLSNQKIRLQY